MTRLEKEKERQSAYIFIRLTGNVVSSGIPFGQANNSYEEIITAEVKSKYYQIVQFTLQMTEISDNVYAENMLMN